MLTCAICASCFDLLTNVVQMCSVSLLLTTTEATIVDRQGEKNPLANRMPNMDDMEMGF